MTALDRLAEAICDECVPDVRDAQLDLVIDVLARRVTVRQCRLCRGDLDMDLYCALCGETTTNSNRRRQLVSGENAGAARKDTR